MKFVSKHANHSISVHGGTSRPIVHPSGVTEFISANDMFQVDFRPGAGNLSLAEINAAKEQLLAGPLGRRAFGSIPGMEEGNINVQDALEEGYTTTAHDGYDPYQAMAVFDTADPRQCPPALRAEVEEFLLSHQELNVSYVRVDNYNLTPPWPTYPVSGEVNLEGLIRFATAGGLLDAALVYEEASSQRPEVIAALREALVVVTARQQEDAALSAQV